MNHIIYNSLEWFSGTGRKVTLDEILDTIQRRSDNGCKLFIGTDSFVSNQKVCFSTAACLYGDDRGGQYFYYKEKPKLLILLTLPGK